MGLQLSTLTITYSITYYPIYECKTKSSIAFFYEPTTIVTHEYFVIGSVDSSISDVSGSIP